MRCVQLILIASFVTGACKARPVTALKFKEGLGSQLNVTKKEDCEQNVLIIFVGNGESLGEVVFRSSEDEAAFGKDLVQDWRRTERLREQDYFRTILEKVEDLKGTLINRDEANCKKLLSDAMAAGQTVDPGSVTLVAITDGPGYEVDAKGNIQKQVLDSKIETVHVGYRAGPDGELQWQLIGDDFWRVKDGTLQLSQEPWEGLLAKSYQTLLANLQTIEGRYFEREGSFSQTNYVFKSHGAPLMNRWYQSRNGYSSLPQSRGNLPALSDLTAGGLPLGNFETAFLLDSAGEGGAPVTSDFVMLLWTPEEVCQAYGTGNDAAACVRAMKESMVTYVPLAALSFDSASAAKNVEGSGVPAGPQGSGIPAGPQGAGNQNGPQGAGNQNGPQGTGNPAGPQSIAIGSLGSTLQDAGSLTLGPGLWSGGTQNAKGFILQTSDSVEALRRSAAKPGGPRAFRRLGTGLALSVAPDFPATNKVPALQYSPRTKGPTMVLFDTCYGLPGESRGVQTLLGAETGRVYPIVSLYNTNPLLANAVDFRVLNAFQWPLLAARVAGVFEEESPSKASDLSPEGKALLETLTGPETVVGSQGELISQRLLTQYQKCQVGADGQQLCSQLGTFVSPADWDHYYERIQSLLKRFASSRFETEEARQQFLTQSIYVYMSHPSWAADQRWNAPGGDHSKNNDWEGIRTDDGKSETSPTKPSDVKSSPWHVALVDYASTFTVMAPTTVSRTSDPQAMQMCQFILKYWQEVAATLAGQHFSDPLAWDLLATKSTFFHAYLSTALYLKMKIKDPGLEPEPNGHRSPEEFEIQLIDFLKAAQEGAPDALRSTLPPPAEVTQFESLIEQKNYGKAIEVLSRWARS